MKKVGLLVLICLLFLLPDLAKADNKKFEVSEKQKSFAKSSVQRAGYAKAEWSNTYILNITLEAHWSGAMTKDDAQTQALLIAAEGYLYTTQNICVNIISSKFGDLSYECAGDQSET